MFTGIVEDTGTVSELKREGSNLHISIEAAFAHELQIDQSIAHNGVCLTVVDLKEKSYTVTAIEETLERSNLGDLSIGQEINLERCMRMNDRLDGHIVQGHVDDTAVCTSISEQEGSWLFRFKYHPGRASLLVDKGSITVNGVSLTVVNPDREHFSVAIIPYTYEHTNFKKLKVGDQVNLEFDIIGKYVARMMTYR